MVIDLLKFRFSRASAPLKGPQTLCPTGFASKWIFAGGVSLSLQYVCSAAPCNWPWCQCKERHHGEKKMIDSGVISRVNDGNLYVFVHHEDLLIKLSTL